MFPVKLHLMEHTKCRYILEVSAALIRVRYTIIIVYAELKVVVANFSDLYLVIIMFNMKLLAASGRH